MRAVFMGTPRFALPALERLIDSKHEIVGVVTQPDKPAGRGHKLKAPPVKTAAEKYEIPVYQPASLKKEQAVEKIKEMNPDVLVVAAYGKIIPESIFNMPRFGTLNIHPSLLPRYRGAAPIQRAIMNGDLKTGVTIMMIDEGLDSGAIVKQEEVDILDDDDALSLSDMLAAVGANLMIEAMDEAEELGEVQSTPQDESEVVYADKITREEGLIDWEKSNEEIICRIKALVQWPSAYTFYNGKRIKINRAEPGKPDFDIDPKKLEQIPHGTIVELRKGAGPLIRTGDGFLLLSRLQPEGKNLMSGADVLNGHLFELGKAFKQA